VSLSAYHPGLLYVIHNGEEVVVALSRPVIEGASRETDFGDLVNLELIPYVAPPQAAWQLPEQRESRIKEIAPQVRETKFLALLAGIGAFVAGTTVSSVLTPWLGLPLLAASLVGISVAYWRRKTSLTEAWRQNHRVLTHYADTQAFKRASNAAQRVISAWPHLNNMVGVNDPSSSLGRSLWDLSKILLVRASLREKHRELSQAQVDLPTDSALAYEVSDRLKQTLASLTKIDVDINNRLRVIEDLAERCQQFIREEQAIARARKALRSANQALDENTLSTIASFEPSNELADRTRSVLDAYRELMADAGSD
jgi:hypothetical protein